MKSIFIWNEYEKSYRVAWCYGYRVETTQGRLIKEHKLECELKEPELGINDDIYLEEHDKYLHIVNKVRTDKDNILYVCQYVLTPQENDKELRDLAEQMLNKKIEENKNKNTNVEEKPKSFLDKLKFWR